MISSSIVGHLVRTTSQRLVCQVMALILLTDLFRKKIFTIIIRE